MWKNQLVDIIFTYELHIETCFYSIHIHNVCKIEWYHINIQSRMMSIFNEILKISSYAFVIILEPNTILS
jgi:hypothetical protein